MAFVLLLLLVSASGLVLYWFWQFRLARRTSGPAFGCSADVLLTDTLLKDGAWLLSRSRVRSGRAEKRPLKRASTWGVLGCRVEP